MFRPLDPFGELRLAAALEAQVVALEPHATPEELDDLRAFPLAHVHQAHRRDTPTAPALGELLRADQQMHRRMRLVDLVKERPRELALARGKAVLPAQVHQLGVVAHVDDAEGFVLGAQPQGHFAGRALQVLDMEPAATGGVENRRKRLVEDPAPARGRGY